MNTILKIFLSMSFSGGLLIAALFLGKQFLKNKISRQWQYYIWLIVILRLLLPFGPKTNLLGKTYQAADQVITQTAPLSRHQPQINAPEGTLTPAIDLKQSGESANDPNSPAEDLASARPLQDIGTLLTEHVWLVWLVAALGLLIRKVTIYQGFMQYIRAGSVPVSDIELLNRLSVAAEQSGVKKPVDLYVNPLISSPLLTGFFHPCIVLPGTEFSEKDFHYIALHELTHYKRRDMLYKWLVQVTVCLHWFNPLVHLMSHEITKMCEFSCDEAVLAKTGRDSAQDYGKTLLESMAAVGRYKENLGAVTLSENKRLLKERLDAIMGFRKLSKAVWILTGALTLCIVFGAAFVGIYSITAAAPDPTDLEGPLLPDTSAAPDPTDPEKPLQPDASATPDPASPKEPSPSQPDNFAYPRKAEEDTSDQTGGKSLSEIERYYENGSLPLFEITFPGLDKSVQKAWLEKLYGDGDVAFFSVALRGLGTDSSLPDAFAEKAYSDGEIAFFSTLTDCMDKTKLESWLDRALADGKWNFQSMLYDKLGRDDEFAEQKDQWEKEWEEAQKAEYQSAGITMDGKNYYYHAQLVNIFLDIRANHSFYTLNRNPEGTVNVKIIRDANDRITGAAYMTDEEIADLLGGMEEDEDLPDDMDDIDDWQDVMDNVDDWQKASRGRVWHPQVYPVDVENIAGGEVIWLDEYTLSEGDRMWYYVFAEEGNGLQVGLARPDDDHLNTIYYSAQSQRKEGEDEKCKCIASFTFQSPVEPGTYRLFLWATDGPLENVKGSISIGYAADAS